MIAHQAAGLLEARHGSSTALAPAPRVLGIVSGKGGVGKSTLAVNLAVAAAARRARVLLIDGDVGLANADLLLGLVPRSDLQDWVEGRVGLDQCVCPGPAGLSLVLAGASESSSRVLSEAIAGDEAAGLARFIAGHELAILDLGAGIGDGVIDLASVCRPVWLVATPEPTSLADAYSTAKRLWERNPRLEIELVVNRAASDEAGERMHLALARLTQRFLGRPLPLRGVLPEEPELIRSVAEQTPLVLHGGSTAVARRLEMWAESVLEQGRSCAGSAPARA